MTERTMTPLFHEKTSKPCSSARSKYALVSIVLAVWAALIIFLALNGIFHDALGTAPISIVYANAIPLGLFILGYAVSSRMRAHIGTFSPSLLAGLHAMRTVGFSFLVLASLDQLPWLFSIPAGIGDIMVAVSAPFIAYSVSKNNQFLTSNRFLWWNIFGIVDFLIAVGSGSAARILGPASVGSNMEPMATLPLVFIPAFLVPMFMISHTIMLIHAYKARKASA